MKNILCISIIFFTLLFSVEKCGFNKPERSEDRSSYCYNLNMQKTILSPDGMFYIHYDTTSYLDGNDITIDHAPSLIDNDGDGIPDYVNEVAVVADYSYSLLINAMNFQDGLNGDDNITDIYILELNGSPYGVARPIDCIDSCIEIDNNYEESLYLTNGVDAMKVTLLN